MAPSRASDEATGLLRLALDRPDRADTEAAALLASTRDPWRRSVARHARGLALRERGALREAVPELRAALTLARQSGDPDRVVDVRASLGATLAMAGRTGAGLAQLDRAVAEAAGTQMRATALMRRGYVRSFIVGRHVDALADVTQALTGIRRGEDRVWQARTLNTLGGIHLAMGEANPAVAAVRRSRELFMAEGQDLEATQALANLGLIAFCQGDLPVALARYDEAMARFAELGVDPVDRALDHCAALLTAGLAADAASVAEGHLVGTSLQPVKRAEVLLVLASAHLASGDPETALARARSARVLFRRQRREWWGLRAELVVLTSRYRAGDRRADLVTRGELVAHALESTRSDEAAAAWLLAGRVATGRGLPGAAGLLEAAAGYRHQGAGPVRATGWLARALTREAAGDRAGVWSACRRGLGALDDYRATLGSAELRASSAYHGDELAAVALRHAVGGSPRRLLWWSERWRATALAVPPVRPPDDAGLAGLLAARRVAARRLDRERAQGHPPATTRHLERELAGLEAAIRHHRLHDSRNRTSVHDFSVEELVGRLGEGTFVELVEVEGTLHAVVVRRGRVRAFRLAAMDEAVTALAMARFSLRQAARGRPATLAEAGARLEAALLGPAARAIGDGPVVVSPTARLHATPWALLPRLRDIPVAAVPSAALWLRARNGRPATGGRVLVVGPGLSSGGAEVPVLASRHPGAVVLGGGSATVERCLRALDGAARVHIAAHGRFRPDSPMFSALELDDGPLTVHDLERLTRSPHRLVLSACESGVMAPLGAGELLGLASVLLSLGTAGVLSSVVHVNDDAASTVMVDVHDHLDRVDDLAEALLRARRDARGDPVREATAASFVPLGV